MRSNRCGKHVLVAFEKPITVGIIDRLRSSSETLVKY